MMIGLYCFQGNNIVKQRGINMSKAWLFGLVSVFLCGMGFSIVMPVVPFLVEPYVTRPGDQAIAVTLLTSVYALCVFMAAPGLGALSDRYGRRPVLLLCLTGSAIGYLMIGIGGALWVLFAGRIIEGLAGGSISMLFAYFADITPGEQRTRTFGWVSAAAGAGSAIGPVAGGLIAGLGYPAPMFAGAALTLVNVTVGFFFMPESLDRTNRRPRLAISQLNPLNRLGKVLSVRPLNLLLLSAFLVWVPSGSLQAIFPQFTLDTFHWPPARIGLILSIIGIQDILSQSLVMPKLLKKLGDAPIAVLGMGAEIAGYAFIAASAWFSSYGLVILGIFVYGFGDSIYGPSCNGMISKTAGPGEQGSVLGGSQSIQALARIAGPLAGGQLYAALGHATPALMGVVLIAAAAAVLYRGALVPMRRNGI